MSYDISFKVKVEGKDIYIPTGDCTANITWNLREMIVASTGLEWKNEANNGLVKDIIPQIERGLSQLTRNPDKYKKYEAKNGCGTLKSCKEFFNTIIREWEAFCEDCFTRDLVDVVYFWIV